MANEISLESVDSYLVATMEELEPQISADTTFRVALLGDWSGRSNRGLAATGAELANWQPILVDRDNLDEVMERLGVTLNLAFTSGSSLRLDFRRLEDFHPDRIFERAEIFQALRQTRERLSNSKTFAQAATEVKEWLNLPNSETKEIQPARKPITDGSKPQISRDNLLDQVLDISGGTSGRAAQTDIRASDLESLVREIVRPHLLPDDSEQESLIGAVDKAIGDEMRAILHNPDFQALESGWRALDLLVSRVETGAQLKFYLLDISLTELRASLMAPGAIEATGAYRLLVESTTETFGGEPWALLAGNYEFDFTTSDAELLKRLSIIGRKAIAPFVAAANSRVVGCESLLSMEDPRDWQFVSAADSKQAWDELRSLPTASYLGLALPRFLLRLPYGSETNETEEFSFEEMAEKPGPQHECYLWANPVFAVVYLLAKTFSQSGWDFRPGEYQEIDDLPIHVYKADGETHIKPCAEILMTVRVAEKIIDHGPMPLISIKDTGTVRLGVFQALGLPVTNLAGRWRSTS
jgi:type VI secretion system protein ImpC